MEETYHGHQDVHREVEEVEEQVQLEVTEHQDLVLPQVQEEMGLV
jgi:hypothetical protein